MIEAVALCVGLLALLTFVAWFDGRRNKPKPHLGQSVMPPPEPLSRRALPKAPVAPEPQLISMIYADADGVVTQRAILLTACDVDIENGRVLRFEGHCQLRDELRRFRPERVIAMAEEPSGRTIPNPERYLLEWSQLMGTTRRRRWQT